jgi:hypothetical protein
VLREEDRGRARKRPENALLSPALSRAGRKEVSTTPVRLVFDIVHPPAVSTSLRTHQTEALLVFLLALAMVAVLYVIRLVRVALLHKVERRP